MRLFLNILSFLCFAVLAVGCKKNPSIEPSSELIKAYLIDGPWQLVSSNQYNGSGSVVRYVGSAADSVIFGFGPGSNSSVNYTTLTSFIANTKNQFSYTVVDSVIFCTAAWKPGYSNEIRIQSCTDLSLVFKINKNNASSNTDGEIDSLKKIRFYH